MTRAEVHLAWFLRFTGIVLLLAAPATMLPLDWMDAIHRSLIGSPLPAGAMVPYLTRSLSGMYASLGAITWYLSTDVRRYASVAAFKSLIGIFFGISLLAIDVTAGLPIYWTAMEGPGVIAICGVGWVLSRRVMKLSSDKTDARSEVL